MAAGNCGFGVAPCRADDHAYLGQLFARVEGMDLAALDAIPCGFETFPQFLASREGRLGLNFGMYVGHSAVRRWVMGDAAYERAATQDEVDVMIGLVDEAMAAGALGFSSSLAPTHLDLADRPIPSRLATLDESLEEAAMDLGARPAKVFFLITLPIILPAILAGWLLAFTLSWDDLVITSFVTGPGSSTLPIVIFSKVRLGVSPDINALATLLVLAVALFTTAFGLYMIRQQKRRELEVQRALAANE